MGEQDVTRNQAENLVVASGLKKWFPVQKSFVENLLTRDKEFVRAVDGKKQAVHTIFTDGVSQPHRKHDEQHQRDATQPADWLPMAQTMARLHADAA